MKIKLKLDSNTDERSQAEWMIFDVLAFLMAIIQSAPPKLALRWSGEVQPTVTTQEETVTILVSHKTGYIIDLGKSLNHSR